MDWMWSWTGTSLLGIFMSLVNQYDLSMVCALIPLSALVSPVFGFLPIYWQQLVKSSWCGILFAFLSIFPDQFKAAEIVPIGVPNFFAVTNALSVIFILVLFLTSLGNIFSGVYDRQLNLESLITRADLHCGILISLLIGLVVSYVVGIHINGSLWIMVCTLLLIDILLMAFVFGIFAEERLRSIAFSFIGVLLNFVLQFVQTFRIWMLDTRLDFRISGVYTAVVVYCYPRKTQSTGHQGDSSFPSSKTKKITSIQNLLFLTAFILTKVILTKKYLESDTELYINICIFTFCFFLTGLHMPLSVKIAVNTMVMLLYLIIGSHFGVVRNGSIMDCILGFLLLELTENDPQNGATKVLL